MKKYTLILLTLITLYSHAATFAPGTQYSVCFSPYKQCSWLIVDAINNAKKSIYVQAYSFTSGRISKALVKAHQRGVKVQVILDKSDFDPTRYSVAKYLIKNGIPVWRDDKLNIAHNKVMIFDGKVVETGSFNFTISADKYNAENELIIHSPALAAKYMENWNRREQASTLIKKK